MRKVTVVLVVLSFLIAGCSNEIEENTAVDKTEEISQSESEIKIALADAHKKETTQSNRESTPGIRETEQ